MLLCAQRNVLLYVQRRCFLMKSYRFVTFSLPSPYSSDGKYPVLDVLVPGREVSGEEGVPE